MTAPSSIQSSDVVLGRYRVVRRLASGGMGVVYLARVEGAAGFARPAVIKRMLPSLMHEEELVRLFVREAQILSRIRHPGVVNVLDFASERDSYLMALEYVHGYHLGQWIKFMRLEGRAFSAELALYTVIQVLDALDYVHVLEDEHGQPLDIVHRDVSPSNILVDVEGHVRLLDFGVARMTGEATQAKDGEVSLKGKFPYLAPELLSQAVPSPASDVYAVGVVLHELLTGQNEFKRPDATETLRRVLLHELSSVEEARADAPEGIDRVLRQSTAREPRNRYDRARDFADELRALLPRSEVELRSALEEAAKRDFLGPLSDRLDLEPLAALDRAWRDPEAGREISWPPAGDDFEIRRGDSELSVSTQTAILDGEGNLLSTRRPRSVPWLTLALGALALAGLAVALVALFRPGAGVEEPRVVILERQRLDSPDPPPPEVDVPAIALPVVESGDEETAVAAIPPDAGPVEVATPVRAPRPRDPAAQLTRRFLRREPRLRECFAEPSTVTRGSPRLEFRFTVDRDGRVDRVELSPASLSGTALGACLLGVARSTAFGPQAQPVTFRIPITVRSGR